MQICVDEGGTDAGVGGGAGLQRTRGGVSGVTLSLRTPSAFGSTGGRSDGRRARFCTHRVRGERGGGEEGFALVLLLAFIVVRFAESLLI